MLNDERENSKGQTSSNKINKKKNLFNVEHQILLIQFNFIKIPVISSSRNYSQCFEENIMQENKKDDVKRVLAVKYALGYGSETAASSMIKLDRDLYYGNR
jgi:hypothetical protein